MTDEKPKLNPLAASLGKAFPFPIDTGSKPVPLPMTPEQAAAYHSAVSALAALSKARGSSPAVKDAALNKPGPTPERIADINAAGAIAQAMTTSQASHTAQEAIRRAKRKEGEGPDGLG